MLYVITHKCEDTKNNKFEFAFFQTPITFVVNALLPTSWFLQRGLVKPDMSILLVFGAVSVTAGFVGINLF